jgi:hypothetical protein
MPTPKTTRKRTGAELDNDLVPLLKVRAIQSGHTYSDYLNYELWQIVKRPVVKKIIKKKK